MMKQQGEYVTKKDLISKMLQLAEAKCPSRGQW